jgi:hypothetical protein
VILNITDFSAFNPDRRADCLWAVCVGHPLSAMPDVIAPLSPDRRHSERAAVYGVWIRRFGVGLLLAVVVVALCNVLGQRASDATVRASAADITVHAPTRVRPGLLFQARVTVVAHQALPKAELVFNKSWIDGLTMNTNEPSASSETSGPDGSLILTLGALQAGQTYTQYFEYQVNPTSFGRRSQTVTVTSNGMPVVSLSRTLTVIP